MATKTKTKKASTGTAGSRPRITEEELDRAKKKLTRKKGFSLVEFSEAMGIKILRARSILKKVKAEATPLGTGKENRTKLYRIEA